MLVDTTKREIVTHNCIPPLLEHVTSSDLRVQRNAAGAILNLTHLRRYFIAFDRRGKEYKSKKIFLISQRKHML